MRRAQRFVLPGERRGWHTCALATDDTVHCWGCEHEDLGQCDAPSGSYSQVSAGDYHTCAVAIDGTIECSGLNDDGQLGGGSNAYELTPIPVEYSF